MKSKTRFISFLLIFSCIFTIPVNAQEFAPYASDQLGAYDITLAAHKGGRIAIGFSVEATGVMKTLGASKIRVYEKFGTDGWILVDSFNESYPGMTVSNKNSYMTTIDYYGTPGTRYKIEVTIFATDKEGVTDSRKLTDYVTAIS